MVNWSSPTEVENVKLSPIDAEVEEFKAHPGRWAKVAQTINRKDLKAYRRRGCEVTQKQDTEGFYHSFVRWPAPVVKAGWSRIDSQAPTIRVWAQAHGFQVSDRGRISQEVVTAFREWERAS